MTKSALSQPNRAHTGTIQELLCGGGVVSASPSRAGYFQSPGFAHKRQFGKREGVCMCTWRALLPFRSENARANKLQTCVINMPAGAINRPVMTQEVNRISPRFSGKVRSEKTKRNEKKMGPVVEEV